MVGGGAGVAPSTVTTGTGVVTALGVNVGSAGAFVTFDGALGTPSSGTVTNLTGTASININGTVGATTAAAGTFTNLTVNDNTTLGSSNADTVTFNGRVNSDLDPATDNAYDLGRVGHEWRDLYIDGTANIDSLIADTADINGGTVDATAIGSTTPSTGAFTTVTASTAIGPASGGTGVANNAAMTVTGSGNFAYTRTLTAATNVTFPITGTLATLAGTETFTNKTITGTKETVFTITDGAAFEINPANGGIQTITLGANRTPAATNFTAGQSVTLMIDDGAAYAVTWSTVNPTWVGATATGSAPTLATSGYNIIELWKVGSTIYAAFVGVA
jgi:hypothetical protein